MKTYVMVQKTLNKQKMKTPNNWITCKLQEVCSTTSGGTPSRRHSEYYKGSIPWIKSGELNDSIILNSEEHISEDAIKNSNAKLFPVGSLLIALYGATIGKMAFLGVPATTNQAICCIFKNSGVNLNFLFYFLLLNRTNLINQGKGGAQKNISQNLLKDLIIPVPPMAEQKRIVKKIEELFGVIDEQVKRLEATQEALVSYRQSILHSLFSSAIGEKVPLEKCLNYLQPTPYIVKSTDYMEAGEVPVLTPGKTFILGFTKEKEGIFTNPLPVIIFDDFTTSTKLVDFPFKVKSSAMKILLAKEGVDIRYIYYIMQILSCPHDTHKRYWISIYAKMRIILPSLPEQKAIVKKIENAFAFADKAQAAITGALEQAKQLKQSILKRAFEGKLVPQDPNDKPVDLTQLKKDKHK